MSNNKIQRVCVIGAGAMGQQIALNAAVYGFIVNLNTRSESTLISAKEWCNKYLNESVSRGKMTNEELKKVMSRLEFVSDLKKAVENVDLVIETIVEKEEIKRDLFERLNKLVTKKAILVSNSSYIPSSSYKDIVNNPSRLANLHYFNPAMRMNLVEIVKGEHTSDETISTLQKFVNDINKDAILVKKEIEGFIVNRLLKALQDEAYNLLENDIASVEDIDLGAEKGLNYPMGPFRVMDFTGLDINYFNRLRIYEETKDPKKKPPKSLKDKVEKNELGRKTGIGWYEY